MCSKLDHCKISLSDSLLDIVVTNSYHTTMAIMLPSRFIRHFRMITCSQDANCACWNNTRELRAWNIRPEILKNPRYFFYVFDFADKIKIPSCSETARKHAFPLLFRHPLLRLRNLSLASCLEIMCLHDFWGAFFSFFPLKQGDLNNNKGGSWIVTKTEIKLYLRNASFREKWMAEKA